MLSGHVQGRLLSMFSHLVRPKLVLDVGTFTAYSALCLAEGLAHGGKVITLEIDHELERSIRAHIAASPYEAVIEPVFKDALQWLKEQVFLKPDLVYLDADKRRYPEYLEVLLPMMQPGALLIADNTLWSGKVLDEKEVEHDEDTRVIDEFNKKLAATSNLDMLMLPLRDGMSVVRKRD